MRKVRQYGLPLERIRFLYQTEKRLAAILRNAAKEERTRLYTELYDEYSRICPDRKILAVANDEAYARQVAETEFRSIRRYLSADMTLLEIGPGAGAFTNRVSAHVAQCIAVDVSHEVAKNRTFPDNVSYLISNGTSIPAETASIDFAYSNQLMEHLHPDDARDQLQEIHRVLKPSGRYLCITPNRLTGPHDISKFFDEVATGFHLKEYTLGELDALMRRSGFRSVRRAMLARGVDLGEAPLAPFLLYERMIEALCQQAPPRLQHALKRNYLTRGLLQATVVAQK